MANDTTNNGNKKLPAEGKSNNKDAAKQKEGKENKHEKGDSNAKVSGSPTTETNPGA